jgi:hypothetical protein
MGGVMIITPKENDATIQGLWIHHSKEYAYGFFL